MVEIIKMFLKKQAKKRIALASGHKFHRISCSERDESDTALNIGRLQSDSITR